MILSLVNALNRLNKVGVVFLTTPAPRSNEHPADFNGDDKYQVGISSKIIK